MKKAQQYLVILLIGSVIGCKPNWDLAEVKKKCMQDISKVYKMDEHKNDATANKLCDCIAEKTIKQYKSAGELAKDPIGGRLIGAECGSEVANGSSTSSSTTSIAPPEELSEETKAIVKAVNDISPKMIDEETRLDKASAQNNKFISYQYTLVNTVKSKLDISVFRSKMKKILTDSYNTNPQLEYFRKNKITLYYEYRDKNDEVVTYFVIDDK